MQDLPIPFDEGLSKNWRPSSSRTIRVFRKDATFFYAVFEASEGVLSYTTLSHSIKSEMCDIRLSYSDTTEDDLDRLLSSINSPIDFF